MVNQDPANPYESYIIEASAGSGKTFQLSRRFLHLVASGADPQEILTVTFTVKAAREMRSRIISLATEILSRPGEAEAFDQRMQSYFAQCEDENPDRRPPRSARDSAAAILSSTQLMRVTTIDAVFREWAVRFALEAGEGQALPQADLFENHEIATINQRAFDALFINQRSRVKAIFADLECLQGDLNILSARSRLEELLRHESRLWQAKRLGILPLERFISHPPNEESELLKSLSAQFSALTDVTNRQEAWLQAVQEGSFEPLRKAKLITRDGRISGAILRGKKRESLLSEVLEIEEALRDYENQVRLFRIQSVGTLLLQLYEIWQVEREKLKRKKSKSQFVDYVKGVSRLFTEEVNSGIPWLILQNTQHLLIDEFQDTSYLQWSIFRTLIEELISGQGLGTAFLVGDRKQAIYGFREADPRVLEHASQFFRERGKSTLPMNVSYRSSQSVLSFVNAVFSQFSPIPEHRTAMNENVPVCPDVSRIRVHELFEDSEEVSALEREARHVAATVAQILDGSTPCPIWDKGLQEFRQCLPSDIAILYRNSTHAEVFGQALRNVGVSFKREEQKGFFSRQEVRDVMGLFQLATRPNDMLTRAHLLRSPLGGWSDRRLFAALESGEVLPSLLEGSEQTQQQPFDFLFQFFGEHAVFERYREALGSEEGELACRNLRKCLELVYRIQRRGFMTLRSVLVELERYADDDSEGIASETSGLVSMMTIHKSKGLEFPLVFIVETGHSWYQFDRYFVRSSDQTLAYIGRKEDQPLGNPKFDRVISNLESELSDEAGRLLYVALTRASQYLFVSGHRPFRPQKNPFHEHLMAAAKLSGVEHEGGFEIAQGNLVQPQEARPKAPNFKFRLPKILSGGSRPDRFVKQPHQEVLAGSGGQGINRFFAQARGSFIHNALESGVQGLEFRSFETWEAQVIQKLTALDAFSNAQWMLLHRDAVQEVERTLESQSFQDYLSNGTCEPEVKICHLQGKNLIKGQVDLLIKKSDEWIAIEYKTSPLPKDVSPHGYASSRGYFAQIRLYQSALARISGLPCRGVVWFTSVASGVEVESRWNPLQGTSSRSQGEIRN